jgi:hypothetical protein
MKKQEQLKDEFLKSTARIRKYERKASMNVEVFRKIQKEIYYKNPPLDDDRNNSLWVKYGRWEKVVGNLPKIRYFN